MKEKSLLMIPGPTPIPPKVIAAMTQPMINHRGQDFFDLFEEITKNLQYVFKTQQPVYVFPGAGSGGWETALVNTVNQGDTVLSVSIGDFGARWLTVAKSLGYNIQHLSFQPGQVADPDKIESVLKKDTNKNIKAVLIQHNETSTGVTNDLVAISQAVKPHGALLMVDSVSGLGAMPLEFDGWELDVVLTGTQKALMCPPGLSIIAFSKRAKEISKTVTTPKFYWDLENTHNSYIKKQTPYTPAISLFYALQASLRMIKQETLVKTWERHRLMGKMCRAGVKALGLELLATDEKYASNSVTAVKSPFAPQRLRKITQEQFGVEIAGGQSGLKDLIFRIGHLGYVTPHDVIQALIAVEMAMIFERNLVKPGTAAAAAQIQWLNSTETAK